MSLAMRSNAEGYSDPTVYQAMLIIDQKERNKKMAILKGDIYYIEKYTTRGSEQQDARPAIVISNNKCNEVSPVIEVVYLTSAPKHDLPTHVTIRSTGRTSIALCEQITSVSIDRLCNYIATVTDDELMNLEVALMVSLGLSAPKAKTITKEVIKEDPAAAQEMADLKGKLACMKEELKAAHNARKAAEAHADELRDQLEKASIVDSGYRQKYLLLREMYMEALVQNAV